MASALNTSRWMRKGSELYDWGKLDSQRHCNDQPKVFDPNLSILFTAHVALGQNPLAKPQHRSAVTRRSLGQQHYRLLLLPPGVSERFVHPYWGYIGSRR